MYRTKLSTYRDQGCARHPHIVGGASQSLRQHSLLTSVPVPLVSLTAGTGGVHGRLLLPVGINICYSNAIPTWVVETRFMDNCMNIHITTVTNLPVSPDTQDCEKHHDTPDSKEGPDTQHCESYSDTQDCETYSDEQDVEMYFDTLGCE